MDEQEFWSTIYIKIYSDVASVSGIASILGRDSDHRSSEVYVYDVWKSDCQHLHVGLELLPRALARLLTVPEGDRSKLSIEVTIAWTPADPQDHLVFNPELSRLLSLLGAPVKLDTWID